MKLIYFLTFFISSFSCVFANNYIFKIFTENLSEEKILNVLSENDDGFRVPFFKTDEFIANHYLILFHNKSEMTKTMHFLSSMKLDFDRSFNVYQRYDVIPAVAVEMADITLNVFRRMREIQMIEQDSLVTIGNIGEGKCLIEDNSEWCLSRVSSIIDKNKFRYPRNAGRGATIYIIDTGVKIDHPEIKGRAKQGKNFVKGEGSKDLNGHGTACASLAAGKRAGVAKEALIVGVKVLNGSGSGINSDIIAAVNWVVKTTKHLEKSIISMSLGGGRSNVLNVAVTKAVQQGSFVVVAAGNEADNACNYSPASAKLAFTVAAYNFTNTLASFSNYGICVDIIAPGVKCLLADIFNDGFTHLSGTSMATPLVAGVAAVHKGIDSTLTPEEMRKILTKTSLHNQIKGDLRETPNLIVHLQCSPFF